MLVYTLSREESVELKQQLQHVIVSSAHPLALQSVHEDKIATRGHVEEPHVIAGLFVDERSTAHGRWSRDICAVDEPLWLTFSSTRLSRTLQVHSET